MKKLFLTGLVLLVPMFASAHVLEINHNHHEHCIYHCHQDNEGTTTPPTDTGTTTPPVDTGTSTPPVDVGTTTPPTETGTTTPSDDSTEPSAPNHYGGGSIGGHRHCDAPGTPSCSEWVQNLGNTGGSNDSSLLNLYKQLLSLYQRLLASMPHNGYKG